MKQDLIAWAAGFFEGEGCITLGGNYPSLRLHNTDEEVVRRFHSVMGVGRLRGPYYKNSAHKPVWIWIATSYAEVTAAFELMRPYLGTRRCERYDELMQDRPRPRAWVHRKPFNTTC